MRKLLPFLVLLALSVAPRLSAQVPDPGAMQDHEAEREKLLKASDQLDNMQANAEATKASVDGMRTSVSTLQANVTQLQADNAALKQQLADLQTSFDSYKADQVKARQALIDNVADMIATQKSATKPAKKKPTDSTADNQAPVPATPAISPALAPPPDPSQPAPPAATTDADATLPPPKQKGYYHVVASGETLTMICTAYRDNGVHVTVAQIRKANGLTEDSELKTGQKLFIPKPGT